MVDRNERIINGIKYVHRISRFSKSDANTTANEERSEGYGARVIKKKSATGKNIYGVFVSSKRIK